VSFKSKSIKNVHCPLSAKGVVFSLHLSFGGTFWVLISPVPKSARHQRMKMIKRKTHQKRFREEEVKKNISSLLVSSHEMDDSFSHKKNKKKRKKNRGEICTITPRGKREKKEPMNGTRLSNDKNAPHRLRVRPLTSSVSPCAQRTRTKPSRRRRGRMISS